MPRPLTSGMLAQLTAPRIKPLLLVQMQFTSGIAYMWTGIGNLQWNGQTWIGVGDMGTISAIEESSEIKATNVTFTLSGIGQDIIHKALGEMRQGYPVQLWFGTLGDNNNVIADPLQMYAGRMDAPSIDEGAPTATISIATENRLIDLNRSRERRYTDQDQQINYPGDLGMQYVQLVQIWNGTWGKAGPGGVPRGPITRPTIDRPALGGGGGNFGGRGPFGG
jgi:hypothetical protein